MSRSESSRKMTTTVAFIAISFTMFSTGSCSSQVPLVMWSSEGHVLPPLASPAAGHLISNVELMSYLNSVLESAPQNVLLFLQDKLSKDDFTRYGGVFGNKQDSAFPNLESALQSSSSPLVLPALSWHGASAVPGLLQEKLGVSPISIDADTLEHVHLNASGNTLLVINLPYSSGAYLSCKDVLRNNDEIIGKVLNIMKTQSVPYTAIYTGLMPSRVIEAASLIGQSSMSRSLLQTVVNEVNPPLMFNGTSGPCIMLWAQNLRVSFSNQAWTDLGPLTSANVSTAGSFCNETNSKLVVDYGTSFPPYNPFRLIFSMSQRRYPVSARNWFSLDTVELEFNTSTVTYNGSRGIYAPAEYSFRCQNVNNFQNALLVPRAQNATQWRILFTDFQIQGFGILNGTTNFSYASDCASFFTPGIWMGLITSLLMFLILTYGLHMIMQLRSMDRFDDPKGPSISVPQSD